MDLRAPRLSRTRAFSLMSIASKLAPTGGRHRFSVRTRSTAGKEWERDSELGYVIQSGPLKNLGLKWKNASAWSNFSSDIDENRLIVSYSLARW